MIISLEDVLQAVRKAGSAEPAFVALLDIVKPLLSADDQAEFQAIYETEKLASDQLHKKVQSQLS